MQRVLDIDFVLTAAPDRDDLWAEISVAGVYVAAVSIEPDGEVVLTFFGAEPVTWSVPLVDFSGVVERARERLLVAYPERVARR